MKHEKISLLILVLIIIFLIGYILFRSSCEYASINDPYIKPFIIKKIISPTQCQEIIRYSEPKLIDSLILSGENKSIRNSKQCWIEKNSFLAKPLIEKVSSILNIAFENAEDLQVVRYLPGQYFKQHHDACCDNTPECKNFVSGSGQRILTVLIYLNGGFEGGYTYFPKLKLKIRVRPGSAIVFHPTAFNSNKCHPLALHAGMPVSKNIKWVANIWYRERKWSAQK